MTQREFTEHLKAGVGKIIRITGPISSYEDRGVTGDSETVRLGLLLRVHSGSGDVPTGRTDIGAGNSVVLVGVLVDGKEETLWVSAKRVTLLSSQCDG